MAPNLNEAREIIPAPPNGTVGGLLAVAQAHILPLTHGGGRSFFAGGGEYWFISASRGSATVASHDEHFTLHPGQAFVLYQRGAFALQAVNAGVFMLVGLRGELPERLLAGRLLEGVALFPQGSSAVREAVLALAALEDEGENVNALSASARAYTMMMTLLGGRITGPGESVDSPLSELTESAAGIIQEEFPFLEGLDELAGRLEVSKAHLIRTFTRETGISPGKYITRVRIEYAKLLLREGENSVTYVAEASGFSGPNYFAKVFRRETGMSPSEYTENFSSRAKSDPCPGFGPVLW